MFIFVIFFVKQKTAYEMRISDWSSDVCSSDLSGLSDWGGARWDEDRFRHDLALLCGEIEVKSDLTAIGRSRTHSRLLTMLVSRLRYLDARKAAAGVDAERVVAPLIGSGMPRAGTTFLHGLFRSEEHTSELQSLMRNSYAVFCLKKKKQERVKYASWNSNTTN